MSKNFHTYLLGTNLLKQLRNFIIYSITTAALASNSLASDLRDAPSTIDTNNHLIASLSEIVRHMNTEIRSRAQDDIFLQDLEEIMDDPQKISCLPNAAIAWLYVSTGRAYMPQHLDSFIKYAQGAANDIGDPKIVANVNTIIHGIGEYVNNDDIDDLSGDVADLLDDVVIAFQEYTSGVYRNVLTQITD